MRAVRDRPRGSGTAGAVDKPDALLGKQGTDHPAIVVVAHHGDEGGSGAEDGQPDGDVQGGTADVIAGGPTFADLVDERVADHDDRDRVCGRLRLSHGGPISPEPRGISVVGTM